MLEKLDTIDWSSLSHAYGEASDVPDLIRGLVSADEETRDDIISALHGSIWHQGTVYEATAYAVPFLIELVESDSISGKVSILVLLNAIADGSSYLDVHQHMDHFYTERNSQEFSDELARELDFVRRAHNAVVEGTSVFLSLLSDENIETKMWTLYTLSTCVEQAVAIETALWERFVAEENSQVKASMLLCLRDLWRYQVNLSPSPFAPSQTQLQRLVKVMRSTDESGVVRFTAALSLVGWVDAEARNEAFSQVEQLADTSWEAFSSLPWGVMSGSIGAITWGFEHLPELRLRFQLGLLQNPNSKIRMRAIFALGKLCKERRSLALQVVPMLGELLSDSDSEVRWWVARTLREFGSAVQLVTESLLAALNDKDAKVRGEAVMAITKTGEKRAIPRIRELLQDAETATAALDTLRKLGPLASDAIDDIRALLRKPANGLNRVDLLLTLKEIDCAGESSLADVVALLRDSSGGTAAWVLSTWGSAAQPAMAELIALLDSPDELTRRNAVLALGNIGAPAAGITSRLASMLGADDPLLQVHAAIALWQIERSELAVPKLIGIIEQELSHHSNDLRFACSVAAKYLGKLGTEASNASSVLLRALKHNSTHIRLHAACSLWQITRNVDETLPVLLEELKHFHGAKGIMDCLAEMGPLAKQAIPKLQQIIESEERVVEIFTIEGWIDQDEAFREMAQQTLTSILGQ
jgi:HEAT repeat protein